MSDWTYVLVGWTVVVATLAGYAGLLVVRGRRLVRRVPVERSRWMDTPS